MNNNIENIFNQAYNHIGQNKNIKISNQDKLLLYGFYKQATLGKWNISKPQGLDMIQTATWNNLNEMSKNMLWKIIFKS